jgi:hypothetical protein
MPPLVAGMAYDLEDFESFEYVNARLLPAGSGSILRLHLKNGTILDLPANDGQLKHLLVMLINAFGEHAVEHLKTVGWFPK